MSDYYPLKQENIKGLFSDRRGARITAGQALKKDVVDYGREQATKNKPQKPTNPTQPPVN
jgi:hypothetical protein